MVIYTMVEGKNNRVEPIIYHVECAIMPKACLLTMDLSFFRSRVCCNLKAHAHLIDLSWACYTVH